MMTKGDGKIHIEVIDEGDEDNECFVVISTTRNGDTLTRCGEDLRLLFDEAFKFVHGGVAKYPSRSDM